MSPYLLSTPYHFQKRKKKKKINNTSYFKNYSILQVNSTIDQELFPRCGFSSEILPWDNTSKSARPSFAISLFHDQRNEGREEKRERKKERDREGERERIPPPSIQHRHAPFPVFLFRPVQRRATFTIKL